MDKQFLFRAESLVNYHFKRISIQEYHDGFEKAILLTIPKYGEISLINWPLSYNEAQLLINISVAFAEKEDYPKAIEIIEEAYYAMKQSFMEEEQRGILQVSMASNLSKWYGLIKNYLKAIEIANEGIALCKKFKLGSVLPYLLYTVAWDKEKLIENGILLPEVKRECLINFKQAFYIASAMQLTFIKQFILQHIEEYHYDMAGFF